MHALYRSSAEDARPHSSVRNIMVSILTLSNHFGILSNPTKFEFEQAFGQALPNNHLLYEQTVMLVG